MRREGGRRYHVHGAVLLLRRGPAAPSARANDVVGRLRNASPAPSRLPHSRAGGVSSLRLTFDPRGGSRCRATTKSVLRTGDPSYQAAAGGSWSPSGFQTAKLRLSHGNGGGTNGEPTCPSSPLLPTLPAKFPAVPKRTGRHVYGSADPRPEFTARKARTAPRLGNLRGTN